MRKLMRTTLLLHGAYYYKEKRNNNGIVAVRKLDLAQDDKCVLSIILNFDGDDMHDEIDDHWYRYVQHVVHKSPCPRFSPIRSN